MMDNSFGLQDILNELAKGNISILTFEVKQYISNCSIELLNTTDEEFRNDNHRVEELRNLLMICNILYNRTDRLVLPVEDGVYDLLTESYKRYDPNFQVGSIVVDFVNKIKKTEVNKPNSNEPIFFYDQVERDFIRSKFKESIEFFDKNKFDKRDIYPIPVTFDCTNEYISKRTHDTKHNHPDLIGTLDKVKFVLDIDAINAGVYNDPNVKILERDFFQNHIKEGIISENQELEMVLELKYDGISVEADCNKLVQSARTRGDTGIGEAADITPILKGYQFKRNNIILHDTIGVKFEAIILRTDMEEFNKVREYNYANCRTAIIGLFGNSDAIKYQKYITLIPIAVDRNQVPQIKNRLEEIQFINKLFTTNGEPLRYTYIKGDYKICLYLIKKFAEEAMVAREHLNFMFDGIVVSYLDEGIRERLGRKNYINKYQMAVKFDPLAKLTTFLGYTYEVGQNGVITPMIHYAPVEFFGTIHPKSSGHSYKRFKELKLKEGDIIQVTYQNDVMPYVTSIDCEQNRNNTRPYCEFPKVCPECGSELVLSKSEKTVLCINKLCPGRTISRMVNMLQKLNIKGFAESTIRQLEVKYLWQLYDVVKDRERVSSIIGPGNTDNLITALENLKNDPIEDYIIIGSLGFTGCAAQIWKLVFSHITLREFIDKPINEDDGINSLKKELLEIPGIGNSIVNTIFDELILFVDDIRFILDNFNIIDSKYLMRRKQIRFSGCRNKQLEEQLISMGYDADGSGTVTKKTDILIIPYTGYTSSKTSKVSKDTLVVTMEDFIEFQDEYLDKMTD